MYQRETPGVLPPSYEEATSGNQWRGPIFVVRPNPTPIETAQSAPPSRTVFIPVVIPARPQQKNLNDGGVVGCGGDLPCKDGVEDSSGREYTDLLDAKQLTRYYTIYSSPPGEEEWLGGDEELGGYGRAKDRDNNEEEAHREEANPKETGDKYPVDKQSSPLDIDCRGSKTANSSDLPDLCCVKPENIVGLSIGRNSDAQQLNTGPKSEPSLQDIFSQAHSGDVVAVFEGRSESNPVHENLPYETRLELQQKIDVLRGSTSRHTSGRRGLGGNESPPIGKPFTGRVGAEPKKNEHFRRIWWWMISLFWKKRER